MALPTPYQWTFRPQTYREADPVRNPGFNTSVPSISIPTISGGFGGFDSVRGPSSGSGSSLWNGAQTILPSDQNLWTMVKENAARQAVTTPVGGVAPERVEQAEVPASFGLLYNKPNLPGAWSVLNTPLGVLANAGIILEGPKNVLWGGAEGLGAWVARMTNKAQGMNPETNVYDDPALGNSGKIYAAASHTDNPLEAIWQGMSKSVDLSRSGEMNNFYNDWVNGIGRVTTGLDIRPTNKEGEGWWFKSDGSGGGFRGMLEDLNRTQRQGTAFIGNILTDPAMFVAPTPGHESANAAKGIGTTLKDLVAARNVAAATAANAEREAATAFAGDVINGAVRETAEGFVPQAAQVAKSGAAAVAENNAVNAASVLGRHGAAGNFNSALNALELEAGNTLGSNAPRSVSELMQTALEMSQKSPLGMSDAEVGAAKAAQELLAANTAYRTANVAAAKAAAEAGEIPWAEVFQQYYRNIGKAGVKKLADETEEQFAQRLAESGQAALEEAAARGGKWWEAVKPFLAENAKGNSPEAMQAVDRFVTMSARDASRLRFVIPFSRESYNLPGGEWLYEHLPTLRESQRMAKFMSGFSKFKADQLVTGSRVGAAISQQLGYLSEGAKQMGAVKGDLTQEAFFKALEQEAAKLAESRTGLRRFLPDFISARRETRRLGGIISLLEQKATYHGIEFGDMELEDWVAQNIKQTTKTIDGAVRHYNYYKGELFGNPEDGLGYATKEEAQAALKERLTPLAQTVKNQVNREIDSAVQSAPAQVVKQAEEKAAAAETVKSAERTASGGLKNAEVKSGMRVEVDGKVGTVVESASEKSTIGAAHTIKLDDGSVIHTGGTVKPVAADVAEETAGELKLTLGRATKKDGKVIFAKGSEVVVKNETKDGAPIVRLVQNMEDGKRFKFGEGATLEEALKDANAKKGIHIVKTGAAPVAAETKTATPAVAEVAKVAEAAPAAEAVKTAETAAGKLKFIKGADNIWRAEGTGYTISKNPAGKGFIISNADGEPVAASENFTKSVSRIAKMEAGTETAASSVAKTVPEATESAVSPVAAQARQSISPDDIEAFKGSKRLAPNQLKDATRQRVKTVFRYGDEMREYYFRKEGTADAAEWVVYDGSARTGGRELFRRPGTAEGYREIVNDVHGHFADNLGYDLRAVEQLKTGHVKVISGPKMFSIPAGESRYSVVEPTVAGEGYAISNGEKVIGSKRFDNLADAEAAAKQLDVIERLRAGGQLKYIVDERPAEVTAASPAFSVARDVADDNLQLADGVLVNQGRGATIGDSLTDEQALKLFGFENEAKDRAVVEAAGGGTLTNREGSTSKEISALGGRKAGIEIEKRLTQAQRMVEEIKIAQEQATGAAEKGSLARRLERAEAELQSATQEKQWYDRYAGKNLDSSAKWQGDADILNYDTPRTPQEMKQTDILARSKARAEVTQGDVTIFTGDGRFALRWDGEKQRWSFRMVESTQNQQDLLAEMVKLQQIKGQLEAAGKDGSDQYAKVIDDIAGLSRKLEVVQDNGVIVNYRPGRSAFLDRDTVNDWLLNENADTSKAVQELVDRNKLTLPNATKKLRRQVPTNWIQHENPLVSANTLVEPSEESLSYEAQRHLRNIREFEGNSGVYDAVDTANVLSGHGYENQMAEYGSAPSAAEVLAGQSEENAAMRARAINDDEFVHGVVARGRQTGGQEYRVPSNPPQPETNRISYEGQRLNWYDQLRRPDMGNVQDDIASVMGNRTSMRGGSSGIPSDYKTKAQKLKELVYSGSLSTSTDWKGDYWIPNIDPKTGNVVVTIKNNVTGEYTHFGTFTDPEAAAYYVNSQTGRAFTGDKATMFFNDEVVDRKLDDILTAVGGKGLGWNYTDAQVAMLRKSVRDIANMEFDIMGKLSDFESNAGFGGERIGAYVSGEVPRRPIPRSISNLNPFARTLNKNETTALYEAMDMSPEQINALNANSKALYGETAKTENPISRHFLNRLGVTSPMLETGEQSWEKARSMTRLDTRAQQLGYGMELNLPRRIGHRIEMGMVATQEDQIMRVAGSLLGREFQYLGKDKSGSSLFNYDGQPVTLERLRQLAEQGGLNNLVVSHDQTSAFSLDKFTKMMIDDTLNPGSILDENAIMQGVKSTSSRWLMPLMTIFSPSFTVNNFVGNVEHALLNGHLTPQSMWEAGKDILEMSRMAKQGAKNPFSMDEVSKIVFDNLDDQSSRVIGMLKNGVMTPASYSQQLAELNGLEAQAGLSNTPGLHRWMNMWRKLNNMSENYFRSAVYHSAIESGMSEGSAIAEVNRVMMDYFQSSLTRTERTIRYFVPFYTFTRRNIPYTMSYIAEHPAMVNNVFGRMPVQLSNLGTDAEGRVITPTIDQYLDRTRLLSPSQRQFMGQIPIFSGGTKNGVEGGDIYATNPKVTFTDMLQWMEPARELGQAITGEHKTYTGAPDFQPFWDEAIQQGRQSLNPIFKMMIEAMSGTDMESGNAIEGASTPERTWNAITGNIPIVGQGINAWKQVQKANESTPIILDENGEPVSQPAQGNPYAFANFIAARFASQYPRKIDVASNNKQWEFYAQKEGRRLAQDYSAQTGNQLPTSATALQGYIDNAPLYSPLAYSPDFAYRQALVDSEYNAWKAQSKATRDSLGYSPVGNSSPSVEQLDRWIRILYASNPNDKRALMDIIPLLPVQAGGLGGGIPQTMDDQIKQQQILSTMGPQALAAYQQALQAIQGGSHAAANAATYGARMFGGR